MLYGMFFLASFALVRGYEESAIVAGLKLAIIPISLGIVAPFAGGLADRMGTRLLSVAGMAICFVALLALDSGRDGASRQSLDRLPRPRGFRGGTRVVHRAKQSRDDQRGAGQSLRRRRRDAQSDARSRHRRGRRQRVRNAVLAAAGRAGIDRPQAADFSPHHFIEAVGAGLIMLAVFAAIAGAVSMIRKPAS